MIKLILFGALVANIIHNIASSGCRVSCGGDPNAEPGCGQNCGRRCSDYKKANVVCTAICQVNGCDCKKGYVYDDNIGKCVLPKDCSPVCSYNEEWNTCANGGCYSARNCSQLGNPTICVDPIECIGGCLCKDGFLRNDITGVCVPINECIYNSKCYGANEQYEYCPITCPPQTCESLKPGTKYYCPALLYPPICQGQCMCKPGFYRNKLNDCISEQDCRKCFGPNEYFACGGACDNVCATLHKQSQDNCPIINIKCNEMCYCYKGYARNDYGVCIPIKDCPPPSCYY